MGKIVYNSQDFFDGPQRPFEYFVEFTDAGGLTIHYVYKDKSIKSIPDGWFKDTEEIDTYNKLVFGVSGNWNTSEWVCARGMLKVTIYNVPFDKSIYPPECFTRSVITREAFVIKISDVFNNIRRIKPKLVGEPNNKKQKIGYHTTTKGEETMKSLNISEITKEIVSDNAEFAKFEAERKIGQTALNLAVGQFVKQFPYAEPFANTPVGKLVIANTFRVAGNMYSGKNKEHVDMITSAIMRGSYATCGDSIDLDAILDGFVDRFKNLIPGLGIDTKASESPTDAK